MEHLENIKDWLKINYLDEKKVPTMGEVRKQRRKKSLELLPDKAGYESTEIYQKFIVANNNLLKYLAENDIFEDENEDWDDWTEDEK